MQLKMLVFPIALFAIKCAVANVVANSFVIVEGQGVSISQDGNIILDKSASGDIEVTARSGWLVNGRKSILIDTSSKIRLKVTSRLDEDEEYVHVYLSETNDVHSSDIILSVLPKRDYLIAMYALPDTSSVVSVSATHKVDKRGEHTNTTVYSPCVCGETHNPSEVITTYSVVPDYYEWRASGLGITLPSSTWSGEISKGLAQPIAFTVTGKRNACSSCTTNATTNVLVDVHELSVTNDLYLGLDRTDLGRTNPVVKTAIAKIDPTPTGSSAYLWTDCGIYSFTGRTDQAEIRYFVPDPDKGSASYLAEPLTVRGTATNTEGLSASANCTTNFTVVKVDVTIGGVGEEKEEKEGAFIPFVRDETNGVISVEGTNKFVSVRFTCEPHNLPDNEQVNISCTGPGELYEKSPSGELVRVESKNYSANEISRFEFALHGHEASESCKDGLIKIEHPTSGATDLARYTSVFLGLKKVSFSGADNYTLISDDRATLFAAPHYLDDNLDGDANDVGDRSYPVCYTRNKKMEAAATIIMKPVISNALVQVRGDGPDNVNIPATLATISDGVINLSATESQGAFTNKIQYLSTMTIVWKVSINGGEWLDAGCSTNNLYATWDKPKQNHPIHTLIHVGCNAANGIHGVVGINDNLVLDAIWARLKTRCIGRASDDFPLTYYGYFDVNRNGVWNAGVDVDKNSPDSCKVTSAAELIRQANGQCHSWADFMNEVMKGQGLASVNGISNRLVAVLSKSSSEAFAVRDWGKCGSPPWEIVSLDAGIDGLSVCSNAVGDASWDATGAPGQGNSPNPPSEFSNHWIVKMNGFYFDPSYGLGPYDDVKKYEVDAFVGSIKRVGSKYFIYEAPSDNCSAMDHADEINDYVEIIED